MTALTPLLHATIVVARAARSVAVGTWAWSSVLCAGLTAWVVLLVQLQLPLAAVGLPDRLAADEIGESTRLLDRNGRLLARLDEGFDRRVVPFREIPRVMRDAVVAVEDQRFWEHEGIDLGAIARAAVANLANREVRQGGSTITMQYARNAYEEVGKDPTLSRKLREVFAALRLEDEMSKEEILGAYLNRVYFGRGAYGVEAAARAYFGKPVRALGLRAAATLAGLIHAPSSYVGRPEALRQRRDRVLERMVTSGFLETGRAQEVMARPLGIQRANPTHARAPYFIEYVRTLLGKPVADGGFGLTPDEIYRGGYTVHTTLDLRMQRAAERAVAEIAGNRGDPEVALVALSTRGEVRAMIGGRNQSLRRARGFNFAVQRAPGGGRSPGSTFKAFALTAYIDQGLSLSETFPAPGTDTVEECGTEDDPWRVSNYDGRSQGSINPIRATELSVNTAYANIVAELGPDEVAWMAEQMGITSPLDPVCSIVLGSSGVTPLEMARAYGTLAARGVRHDVVAIESIRAPDGSLVTHAEPFGIRVVERDVVDTVNGILQRVMTNGTGTPAQIGRPAAGKTGTSEGKQDLWFVGFTPHPGLVASVWVGHRGTSGRPPPRVEDAPGRPATGGGFAGAVWREFMESAVGDMPVRDFADVSSDPTDEPTTRESDSIEREDDDTVVVHGDDEESSRERPEPSEEPSPDQEPEPSDRPKPSGSPSPS